MGCSRLGGCAGAGLWVTQARGRAQGTVQGSDVAHDRGVGQTQGTGAQLMVAQYSGQWSDLGSAAAGLKENVYGEVRK